MKKGSFLLAVAITFFGFSDSFAAENAQESQTERKISLKTVDTLEVGLQSYWYKYEEEVNGNFFMSNEGHKYGLSLTGIKTLNDDFYVVGDVRFAVGDVEYNSASGTGDVSDSMYEIRLLAGKEARVDGFLLSSYIGLGYRRLNNDLRDLGSGG